MGRLFKIEMKKLWKSTAMRVMLLVSLGLCLFNVVIFALMKNLMDGLDAMGLGVDGYYAFPTAHYVGTGVPDGPSNKKRRALSPPLDIDLRRNGDSIRPKSHLW